jgi:asparagine synthase (glutamine-hydrolysing)
MCGINGIYGFGDGQQNDLLIRTMNKALAHRGPDDEGVFSDETIALGHRRLSIIDLSSAGHQPLFSADNRYCIVYNGELYNYKELRFELQRIAVGSGQTAYPFATGTDTEVILAAYLRWGKDCVKHFNGMFAFAIWDKTKKELFVARDRLGIKPLYYYIRGKTFLFSSEIRALLKSGLIPKKVDHASLVDYLRYQTVQAPRTIIKDVGMLMPGHSVLVNNEGVHVEQYWNAHSCALKPSPDKSYQDICKDVYDLLLRSVERRLIADVPFGAFLSGGIDSSIIVALMSKVSTVKVKTFSVTFDESEFSEARFARQIAEKYNTEHHELKLKVSDFLLQVPEALKAMDHPSGDGINTYVVSKATREAGITMALSGLGGDELFAGYDIFKRSLMLERRKWMLESPAFIRSGVGLALRTLKPGASSDKISELLRLNSWKLSESYPVARRILNDSEIRNLLQQDELPPNSSSEYTASLPPLPKGKILSGVSLAETGTYMSNILLRDADQMSMAVALEVRVPFLDHTLVEYLLALSDDRKYPHSPKKLLVDAVGDLLPSEIVNRPKMGFTFPWKHWLRNELRDFCSEKMTALSGRSGFNKQRVLALWQSFLADDPRVTWSKVWYLVVLESWLHENEIDV